MSSSTDTYLGLIAAATLLIAIVQLAVLIAAGVLARRVARLSSDFEQQVKPIFNHLDALAHDAARAASLATTQVERADCLFADVAGRVEQGMDSMQHAMSGPAREGAALMSAFRAAFAALKHPPVNRARGRGDDEDALFI